MSKESVPAPDVERSNLIVPAFTTKFLQEEKEDTGSEILTLRVNPEDRIIIDELKYILTYSMDSTVIKLALEIARNVLLRQFSPKTWSKITSQTRRKQEIKMPKSLENS